MKQGNKNGIGVGDGLWTRLETDLSRDPHLTDAEFIEFAADVVGAIDAMRLRNHVARCSVCSRELGVLREIGTVWDDPARVGSLEARIAQTVNPLPRELDTQAWWAHAFSWTSLAPLGRGLAAMAATDEVASVDFTVQGDDDTSIEGLAGVIQRRGDEYYVRVAAAVEVQEGYRGRMIDIVTADNATNQLTFQRKIGIGQFVLIGTKLDIASVKLTARLLP